MFKRLRLFFSHPFLLAALSAVLLRLAYPTFDVWGAAWCALVPLLAAVARLKYRAAFLTAFLAGFLFFGLTVYWVVHVTIPGTVILALYCGLYFGLFGAGFRFVRVHFGWAGRCVGAASLWVGLEYLRAHIFSGFPWALLGYSQTENLPAIQIADTFGVYGVSFLLVLVNVAWFESFDALLTRSAARPVILRRAGVVVVLVGVWLGYGAVRLYQDPLISSPLRVALVQANIAQEIKWVPRFSASILDKYVLMTQIAQLKDDPDLLVWPETSFPEYLVVGDNDAPLQALARDTGRQLLVGSIRLEEGRFFNSALLYLPSGVLGGLYDKLHLVPFGEFLPGRSRLPLLEKLIPIEDFTRGRAHTIFSLKGERCPLMRAGVLICFEDIFSSLARASVRNGADILINMTNDGWFKDTASPYQHYQASVFRAVENRVYVVRAANTGVSCIIDDTGRTVMRVEDSKGKPTFVSETGAGIVYKTGRRALYTTFGDLFVGGVFLMNLVGGIVGLRRKRRGNR